MTTITRSGRGRPVIRITRDGPRLVVSNVSRQVYELLHDQLSYDFVRSINGKEARIKGKRAEIIRTKCFRYVVDNDGLVAPQVITNAGWYLKIARALDNAGYLVKYKDHTPPSRGGPKVYDPLWYRLEDVSYKWQQEETLRRICNSDCGRIICPTGYGKSFLITCLATLYPKARFVITTHSKEVIEMLYEDLEIELPSVGIITGAKKDLNRRVMCVSGKSLHHAPADTDFLIVDEMQEFATQDYLGRLARFVRSRNYGFSANEEGERSDKADFELEGPFGPVLINLPYDQAVAHGAVVQIRVRWFDVVMDINPCEGFEDDVPRKRNGLWRNKVRNELIAKAAKEYQDKQVLITVDTVEHAVFLKHLLPEFTMVYSEVGMTPEKRERYIRWGLINRDEPTMTPNRRWQLKKDFESGKLRKAIATTVWNRGVNFRQLQVLIRCDAKSKSVQDKQIPGRLSRLSKGKPYGLLVDFYDQFDKGFSRKAKERRAQYKKLHWDMIEPDDTGLTRLAQGGLFE